MLVFPFERTAVIIIFAVPVTDGSSRRIFAPTSFVACIVYNPFAESKLHSAPSFWSPIK
jgi:hypothetical protein